MATYKSIKGPDEYDPSEYYTPEEMKERITPGRTCMYCGSSHTHYSYASPKFSKIVKVKRHDIMNELIFKDYILRLDYAKYQYRVCEDCGAIWRGNIYISSKDYHKLNISIMYIIIELVLGAFGYIPAFLCSMNTDMTIPYSIMVAILSSIVSFCIVHGVCVSPDDIYCFENTEWLRHLDL